jgi:hypothetical protein
MSLMNKLLLIAFGVLVVVVIFEVYYFMQPSPQPQKNVVTQPKATSSGARLSTQTVNQAIDETSIQSLRNYKKGVLVSSVLENTIEGVITEIDSDGGEISMKSESGEVYTQKYSYRIVVKNTLNNSELGFNFDQNALSKAQFMSGEGDSATSINISELVEGDNVRVVQKLNLLQPVFDERRLVEFKLIKV